MNARLRKFGPWIVAGCFVLAALACPDRARAQSRLKWSPRRPAPKQVAEPIAPFEDNEALATPQQKKTQVEQVEYTPQWQRNPREGFGGPSLRQTALQVEEQPGEPVQGVPERFEGVDPFEPDVQYEYGPDEWEEGYGHDIVYEHGGPCAGPGCTGPCCAPCGPWAEYGPGWGGAGFHWGVFWPWLYPPSSSPCGPWAFLHESSVFAGVHAFKGPLDQGQNGNFGFNEGLNIAGAFWHYYGIGYQVGGRFSHSNFSGDRADGGTFRDAGRDQSYLTVGLFHRAWHHDGWQWGVMFDVLEDDFYVDNSLNQMRVEVSRLFGCVHEIGFWGAFGTKNDDEPNDNNAGVRFKPVDIYAGYYRHNWSHGGQGRAWFGGTDRGDGILGADFRVPVSNNFDLTGAYNYLIPKEGGSEGEGQEAWGISMNLVWYFGRCKSGCHNSVYRPLMNVADSTVFIVDRVEDGE